MADEATLKIIVSEESAAGGGRAAEPEVVRPAEPAAARTAPRAAQAVRQPSMIAGMSAAGEEQAEKAKTDELFRTLGQKSAEAFAQDVIEVDTKKDEAIRKKLQEQQGRQHAQAIGEIERLASSFGVPQPLINLVRSLHDKFLRPLAEANFPIGTKASTQVAEAAPASVTTAPAVAKAVPAAAPAAAPAVARAAPTVAEAAPVVAGEAGGA